MNPKPLNIAEQARAILAAEPWELRALEQLALGRIFRLGSRPTQEGDIAQYEDCRRIIMLCAEARTGHHPLDKPPHETCHVRHSRFLGH